MIFKPFPLSPRYQVSDTGVIMGLSGHPLKLQKLNKTEYLTVTFGRKLKDLLCHRVVAYSFGLLNEEQFRNGKMFAVNHKDSCKSNNNLSNLEVTSYSGNLLHYHSKKYSVTYLVRNCSLEALKEAILIKEAI